MAVGVEVEVGVEVGVEMKDEHADKAELNTQLAADTAMLCYPEDKPYLPWDWLRVRVGGHEYETRVQRLEVAPVDGATQVVVCTSDGRVWQQRYLGGWLLSWYGTRLQYEPVMSATAESRIIDWRAARQRTISEIRRGAGR